VPHGGCSLPVRRRRIRHHRAHTNAVDAEIFADRIREIIAETRFKPEGIELPSLLGTASE